MYERILLTLDSSRLAEKAIPHAAALAKAFQARLCLLSVVPVIPDVGAGGPAMAVAWEAQVDNMEEYLAGVQQALRLQDVDAEVELRRGNVTEEVLLFSHKFDADLVVMSTHGRSGLGRWVYGSVADRVLRHAEMPVLLVRVSEDDDEQD
jgi:nucleotide-binding universal stress UspA family protein